jgi:hypothetical protein
VLSAGVAPIGGTVTADVLIDEFDAGGSIFTPSPIPTLTSGMYSTHPGVTPTITSFVSGDYFTVRVLASAGTIVGSDITVTITYLGV